MPDHLPSVGPVGDLPEVVEAAARAMFASENPGGEWEDSPLVLLLEWRELAAVALAASLPLIRTHIADQQQAIVDRELARYDPADNYGEAMEHSLVADIGRKLIAVTWGDNDA